jgi:hypothetical protein
MPVLWVAIVFFAANLLYPLILLPAAAGAMDDLVTVRNETSHRASSSGEPWQDNNADSRPIQPGQTLTLADLDGPGEIRHIWFTIAAQDPFYPESLVFRIYYDDRERPGVESPLGDFFGVGHGLKRSYQSLPIEVSSEGRGYNCFWRMPFRKRARLEVTNQSDQKVDAFYYYIDWVSLPALPHDTAYFHAQYRQEKPCQPGKNYLILEAEGRGHYVGTVLSVCNAEPSWFGEGDDFIFIDGANEPQLKGTGTEDYFSDGWGFRVFQHLNHGVTLWEGYEAGDRGTVYRWHIQDPIRFSKSIRVEIEHKGARLDSDGSMQNGFVERADDYATVAFWYQQGVPVPFTTLPPLSERMRKCLMIEAEDAKDSIRHSSGELKIQEGGYTGGKQLLFIPSSESAELALPFEIKEPLKAALRLNLTTSWDYGIYEIRLDDGPSLGIHDLYSPSIDSDLIRIKAGELKAGTYHLLFKGRGSNAKSHPMGAASPGYNLGIDSIEVMELP